MSLEIALHTLAGVLVWTLGGTFCVARLTRRCLAPGGGASPELQLAAKTPRGQRTILAFGMLGGPYFILLECLHSLLDIAIAAGFLRAQTSCGEKGDPK